jgi:hypothetical protein
MKRGDKVWVECEIEDADFEGFAVGYRGNRFFVYSKDCRPVEPEAVEQKKLKAIFKVKGHDRRGTVGTITRAGNWLSLFESTDGKFLRWCHDSEFDLLDESGKRISQSSEPEAVGQPASDPVNPSHYKQGSIECIEAIKSALGLGFIAYLWGNILKYLWRWPNKNGIEDLKKARWYLDRLIQEEETK